MNQDISTDKKQRAIPWWLPKALCIAVPIIIVLAFALYHFCITTPYTYTFTGVVYERGNTDPAHLKPVTVTLNGKLRRYIWQKDYFTGEIDFDGFTAYDHIHDGQKLSEQSLERYYSGLRLYYNDFPGRITEEKSLTYWRDSDGNRLDTSMIFIRGITDEEPSFLMAVSEPEEDGGYHWTSDDGLYIVCPAATVDEAEAVVLDTWAHYNELNPNDPAIQ